MQAGTNNRAINIATALPIMTTAAIMVRMAMLRIAMALGLAPLTIAYPA